MKSRLGFWHGSFGVSGGIIVAVENEESCDWSSVATVRLSVVVSGLVVVPDRGLSRNDVAIAGTGGGRTGGASPNAGLGGL